MNKAEETLARIARLADGTGEAALDIAEAALLLGSLDRPGVPLDRYRAHLSGLVDSVAARRAALPEDAGPAAAVGCLVQVITEAEGYTGDSQTYDDLQNANLMRVIDRRKGLPVALGILYIHAARGQGWGAFGLNFPNHFLIAVEGPGGRTIIDPYHDGRLLDTRALRTLLKQVAGAEAELTPERYAAVSDRMILLRLLNNIKLRLIRNDRHDAALDIVARMRTVMPEEPTLLREAGLLQAQTGNLKAAVGSLRAFLESTGGSTAERHHAARVIQILETRLN